MGLKLFRTTEYSSSSLFTHTRPQAGVWPATLLVLSGLWLAVLGNLALWRAVAHGTEGGGALPMALLLGAGMAAFNCVLLSLVAWRRLLKLAITILLLLAAVGTHMLLGEANAAAGLQPWPIWQRLLVLLVVALLPMLWVWRLPVRLISARRQLAGNIIILAVSLAVLAGVLFSAGQNLQALVRYEPGWACMINPAAPALKLTGRCVTVTRP